MSKGEFGPLMYLILAVITLVAIIIVVMSLSGKSWGIVDFIRGAFP